MRLRRVAYGALAGVGTTAVRMGIARRLPRILAYHDVVDAENLERQLRWATSQFHAQPLSRRLSTDRSLVVTFDDGHPSVVDHAMPVLRRLGITATMFVCPGVIDTDEPFWWTIVERAVALELTVDGMALGPDAVSDLKKVPDLERRRRVDLIREAVEAADGASTRSRQLTTEELREWVDAGNAIGNHTWDHPLLDKCDADEQWRQIAQAHVWLADRSLMSQSLFAYPNGNYTTVAASALASHGYDAAVLFDHRLSSAVDPLRLSRIRVNSDDEFRVFVARVTGVHPLAHHALHKP